MTLPRITREELLAAMFEELKALGLDHVRIVRPKPIVYEANRKDPE